MKNIYCKTCVKFSILYFAYNKFIQNYKYNFDFS